MLFGSLQIKAQAVREIAVDKPGKLEKIFKKLDSQEFRKIKLTGILNCKDIDFLNSIHELEYLDLRDIKIDLEYKKCCGSCKRGVFVFHDTDYYRMSKENVLKVFYAPLTGFSELEIEGNITNVEIHIPYGMAVHSSYSEYDLHIDGEAVNPYNCKFTTSPKNKVLYVEKKSTVSHLTFEDYEANTIFIEETGEYVVFKWAGGKINNDIIKNIIFLGRDAFNGITLPETVEFSGKLKTIPGYCVDNNDLRNPRRIILHDGTKEIDEHAFHRGQYVNIPASVEIFPQNYNVDTIEIESRIPPKWLRDFKHSIYNGIYIIPDGTLKDYYAIRPDMNFIERNPKGGSYTINVPRGNSILSYISLPDLKTADSLTITGVLYEDDFKFIRQARNLKYLDISACYTSYSPEAWKAEQDRQASMSALFGLISKGLDDEFRDYKIGTIDYKVNKSIADAISKAYSKGVSDDRKCLIPHNALSGMENLVYLKLPILVTQIGPNALQNCEKLETVILPPFLTRIASEAFKYCHSLKDVAFPKTLYWIQKQAFYNCNGIKKVEFPKETKMKSMEELVFGACVNLEELYFPEGLTEIPRQFEQCYRLKKVVYPNTVNKIAISDRSWDEYSASPCEFYFNTPKPPSYNSDLWHWENKDILYVPKGTITAYKSKYGNQAKILEK